MPDKIEWFADEPLIGLVGEEMGHGLAFRNNGEEILFASREMAPLRWVPITKFIADPKVMLSADEMRKEMDREEEDPGE